MGGLGKYMPLTAAAAIVAAMGISGVPRSTASSPSG